MLSYPESREQLTQIFKLINSGRYYSMTFMKVDGTIRFLNGHKAYYKPKDGPTQEVPVAKPTQLEQGILLVWDRNAVDYKTGEKGAYRKSKLGNIMFIKSGQDVLDFMEENDIQKRFNLSDQQIESAKRQMKIDTIEEEFKIFEEENMISENFYNVTQLLDILKRFHHPEAYNQFYEDQLRKAAQKGDDEVAKIFKMISKIEIFPVSRGRFSFEPVGGGGEDQLE